MERRFTSEVEDMTEREREVCERLGISPKYARDCVKMSVAVEKIKCCLPVQIRTEFMEQVGEWVRNRKNGVSKKQFIALSKKSPEVVRDTVAKMMQNPLDAKAIVREVLGTETETKVTIILPVEVADFYTEKAKDAKVSKSGYIARVLTGSMLGKAQ